MFLMMSESDSPSLFFFRYFFSVSLKDFASLFVPDVVRVAWLSFIFRELEKGPIFGVDFNLTECFEFTIVTYLNYYIIILS